MNASRTFPEELTAQKNVLFITTKNLDYIRNEQELAALRRSARRLLVVGYRGGNNLTRLLRVWLRLLFLPVGRFDTVFIGFSAQLVLPFWGWKFKKQTVLADCFVSLYDTFVCDRQTFRRGSPAARLLHRLDTAVCRRADTVFADTRAHAAYFMEEFGLREEKARVLYLQADTSIYFPRRVPPTSPGPPFVVLYFGSILPLQGVDVILQCIWLMRWDTQISFDIIGPIPQKERERCAGLPNARFTRWLPQRELAGRIAQAQLCLAGHFNAHIQKAARTIPGKAYIYRAMGKPMILGDNPANRELFEADEQTVYYVKMGDAERLADEIRRIARRMGH